MGLAALALICMLGIGIGAFAAGWVFHEERDRGRS